MKGGEGEGKGEVNRAVRSGNTRREELPRLPTGLYFHSVRNHFNSIYYFIDRIYLTISRRLVPQTTQVLMNDEQEKIN